MSRKRSESFVAQCLRGIARLDAIDDFIDQWHAGGSDQDLHEFLGMTWKEYSRWVAKPDLLPAIVEGHREGKRPKEGLGGHSSSPMAARSG